MFTQAGFLLNFKLLAKMPDTTGANGNVKTFSQIRLQTQD